MYMMGQEEIDAVARVINSGKLFKVNDGPFQETKNFEKEMCEKMDVSHTLLMTSGHAALESALVGLGLGPGDEVIVPAYTYIATAMAVVATGAMPVIAEIDESLALDPTDIENKITERTKAILPVHMQGHPCNMDAIMKIAKKHNLAVIEDACQAVGGSYKGKSLGTIGDAGAFSFNYFKVLTAGEGGALLTNNQLLFERALIYHDSSAIAFFGNQMDGFSTDPFCGVEYRTNEITAAIMREQLKKLDTILDTLKKNRQRLAEKLSPYFNFIPSNDKEGDCSIALTLLFDSEDETRAVAENTDIYIGIPYDTGKHVYTRWTPILEKKGAFHPLMNPFNFEANKHISYSEDCCIRSLEIMKRTGHIPIRVTWDDDKIDSIAENLINAKKKIK